MEFSSVIIEPVLTEKSHFLKSKTTNKSYAFYVAVQANKYQIAESFAAIFGFYPVNVRTLVYKSRKKRRLKNGAYAYKKARKVGYITVPDGVDLENLEETLKQFQTTSPVTDDVKHSVTGTEVVDQPQTSSSGTNLEKAVADEIIGGNHEAKD